MTTRLQLSGSSHRWHIHLLRKTRPIQNLLEKLSACELFEPRRFTGCHGHWHTHSHVLLYSLKHSHVNRILSYSLTLRHVLTDTHAHSHAHRHIRNLIQSHTHLFSDTHTQDTCSHTYPLTDTHTSTPCHTHSCIHISSHTRSHTSSTPYAQREV